MRASAGKGKRCGGRNDRSEHTICVVSGPGRKVRPQARRHEHRQPSRSSVPTRSEAATTVAGSAGGAHGVTRPTFSESPALDRSGMMAGSGDGAAETAGRAGPVPGFRTKVGVQQVLSVSCRRSRSEMDRSCKPGKLLRHLGRAKPRGFTAVSWATCEASRP